MRVEGIRGRSEGGGNKGEGVRVEGIRERE